MPQETIVGRIILDQLAQPTFASTDYPEKGHVVGVEQSVLIFGDDPDEGLKSSHDTLHQHGNDQSLEQASSLNGPQISELLSGLPPVRQIVVDGTLNDNEPATTMADAQQTRSSGHPISVSNLHSEALDQAEDAGRPVSPVLSKVIEYAAPAEAAEHDDEAMMPMIPDNRRSSQAAAHFSSVSRAMSMLSETSIRSGLRSSSLGSSRYKKLGSTENLTTRPRSCSKPQVLDRAPANKGHKIPVDNGQNSERGTANSRTGSTASQPKKTLGNGFTKAIRDIESVLQEALDIVGHTANSDSSKVKPDFLQSQRNAYIRADSETSTGSSDAVSSFTGGTDLEASYITRPQHLFGQGHEHVSASAAENDRLQHDDFKDFHDTSFRPAQARSNATMSKIHDVEPLVNRQKTQQEFFAIPGSSPKGSDYKCSTLHRPASTSTD